MADLGPRDVALAAQHVDLRVEVRHEPPRLVLDRLHERVLRRRTAPRAGPRQAASERARGADRRRRAIAWLRAGITRAAEDESEGEEGDPRHE